MVLIRKARQQCCSACFEQVNIADGNIQPNIYWCQHWRH